MLNRTLLFLCLLAFVLSSCASQPTLHSNIADSKSKLLAVTLQKTDFDVDTHWDVEGISQKYEIPSTDNHGLIESSSRRLIGTMNKNQLVLFNHRLSRYDDKVDWSELVSLIPGEGYHPVDVVFPTLRESMSYQCYADSLLLTCQIIVQSDSIISKLDFQMPQSLLKNDRIEFVDSVLLKIDARISQYK